MARSRPFRPCSNADTRCARSSFDPLLRNPFTDIAGCCARATIGHSAPAPVRKGDEIAPSIASSAMARTTPRPDHYLDHTAAVIAIVVAVF